MSVQLEIGKFSITYIALNSLILYDTDPNDSVSCLPKLLISRGSITFLGLLIEIISSFLSLPKSTDEDPEILLPKIISSEPFPSERLILVALESKDRSTGAFEVEASTTISRDLPLKDASIGPFEDSIEAPRTVAEKLASTVPLPLFEIVGLMVLALKEASRSPPFVLEIAVSLFAASIEAAKLPLVDESSVVPSILLSESRLKFAVDLATLKVKPETSAESTSREVGFFAACYNRYVLNDTGRYINI
jgi:hypothetical protein